MDEWKLDICVTGSQKGFMLPAGAGHRARQPARDPGQDGEAATLLLEL